MLLSIVREQEPQSYQSESESYPEESLGSERSSQVKATHGRTQKDPPRCKSIKQEKGRKNEASSITSRC